MRKVILLSFCLIFLSTILLFSASKTNAQDGDFSVVSIDPDWEHEKFLTLEITTAAIAFDPQDNLYFSDIDPWGSGPKDILRLEAPEYIDSSLYLSYETSYEGINGLDFDDKGNLFVSEFMGSTSGSDAGAIRKIRAHTLKVSDPIDFPDFRPTGIAAIGFDTIYFPGRKWSDEYWGNIYKIDSFKKFEPNTEPTIVRKNSPWTAIAIDDWGNFYAGIRSPVNSVYTRNPYTGEIVWIAKFSQYVEELAFDSHGNLYALDDARDEDPSTIIKLIPPHIVIDGCNTGIINWCFPDESTIGERIDGCATTASSHDEFVGCVVNYVSELMRAGTISAEQMGSIITCAAQADIP